MTSSLLQMTRRAILVCSALFLITACGGGDKSKAEKTAAPATKTAGSKAGPEGVVLHRGNGTEPNTLDPHQANGVWENNIIGDMFLGLYTEDEYAKSVNGAAIDHSVTEDGLIHTFKLRPGMVWSDGVPVTAADFVFAWQRILTPEIAAPYASLLYPFKNAQQINAGEMDPSELGATAVDDLTIRLETETPVPFIKTLMTHYTAWPVPKHAIEKYGDDWIKPKNLVVNGAFKATDWRPNSYVRSVKNEKFYDADSVKVDTVYYYPIDDVNAAFRRFRAGEIDLNTCTQCYPIQQVKFIDENMPGTKRNESYLSTTYIAFNTNRPPYDDARVRRALGLMIDRDIIVTSVLRAGQVPAYGLVPPGIDNYVPSAEYPKMPEAGMTQDERNVIAKDLLKQAGFDESNPLTITVKYRLSGDRKAIMVAMQNMWKQQGVTAELDGKEPKVAYADYRSRNFDIADAGWVADYNDPDNFLFIVKGSTGKINYSDYKNPVFDAKMNEAAITLDLKERAKIMAEAETMMLADMPIVPLYFDVQRNIVGTHISGWGDNALGIHRSRWLTIDESKRKTY